jgi:hypothetical protein
MNAPQPAQLISSVASAAGSGLETAGQLVAEATESLGELAGAAIDVGGNAAGVIADTAARSTRKAWKRAPELIDTIRRHKLAVAAGAAALLAVVVAMRARRHSTGTQSELAGERPVGESHAA